MPNIQVSAPAPAIHVIRFNRPNARDALSLALLQETAAALHAAQHGDSVRAVVLTGDAKAFCAGADIKEMSDTGIPMWGQSERLLDWKTLDNFPEPRITAVEGYALGAGCEMTLLCDNIIAGQNARLGQPEVAPVKLPRRSKKRF